MNRTVTVLLSVSLLFSTARLRAADSNAGQLLQHGIEVSNIRTSDTAPFRLKARVHMGGVHAINAEYLLIWAAPNRWREEITTEGGQAIRIGGTDTVSTKNDSADAQTIRSKLRVLDIEALLRLRQKQKLSGVKNRRRDGTTVRCVSKEGSLMSKTEFCFDAQSNVIVAQQSTDWTDEFTKYVDFRGKQFPQMITTSVHGRVEGSVEVDELAALTPDPLLFAADATFQTTAGCEHPTAPTPIELPDPEYPPQLLTTGRTVKMVATVNTAGRVEDISVVNSVGELDRYAVQALRRWKFFPATCGSTAVPFRFFTDINFR